MTIYTYYVVYGICSPKQKLQKIEAVGLQLSYKINSLESIEKAVEVIERQHNYTSVVLINWSEIYFQDKDAEE